MATMTLAQAARQMEESGTQIKVGHFDTFADFMLYFEQHYKPMLEQRNEGMNTLDDNQWDLLHFFLDDMQEAFSEEDS